MLSSVKFSVSCKNDLRIFAVLQRRFFSSLVVNFSKFLKENVGRLTDFSFIATTFESPLLTEMFVTSLVKKQA